MTLQAGDIDGWTPAEFNVKPRLQGQEDPPHTGFMGDASKLKERSPGDFEAFWLLGCNQHGKTFFTSLSPGVATKPASSTTLLVNMQLFEVCHSASQKLKIHFLDSLPLFFTESRKNGLRSPGGVSSFD